MQPSFEERSVWVQLFSVILVLGGYLVASARLMRAGITEIAPFVPLFSVAVVLLVVLLGVGHAVAAAMGKPEKTDERDRLIGWRAESSTSWLLATGVVGAIAAILLRGEPVWVAHILLASLFVSEVAKLVVQLVLYRRGV